MKCYVFPGKKAVSDTRFLLDTLQAVADGTDTHDLVVALYVLPGKRQSRGTAYVHHWMVPDTFLATRGNWRVTQRFGIPDGLPDRFKLIRMRIDDDSRSFPKTEQDGYHWEFRYRTFQDQLALLFAHELHHYRRHHLNLHPRGGERSANRWALHHVQALGFDVTGKSLPMAKKGFSSRTFLIRHFPHLDPYADFRSLKPGSRLRIRRDPRNQYIGQSVILVRAARLNSKRLVVQTPDGKIWRWPMAWLKVI
jgi:hypothetical protein